MSKRISDLLQLSAASPPCTNCSACLKQDTFMSKIHRYILSRECSKVAVCSRRVTRTAVSHTAAALALKGVDKMSSTHYWNTASATTAATCCASYKV
jgi:hypothetical protein